MNLLRATGAVAICALGLTAASSARASCFFPIQFGQLDPSCGGGYCYVVSPGPNTAASRLGDFWTFGSGRPEFGVGSDSGAWPASAWLHDAGPGSYIQGTWAESPAIDGCTAGHVAPGKTAEIMVAAISDSSGGSAYFAVAAVRRRNAEATEFDFTLGSEGGSAGNIQLVPIPRPRAVSSTRETITWAAATVANVAAGFYSDASLVLNEAILGWRMYSATGPDPGRVRANWTSASNVIPLGQTLTLASPCGTGTKRYAASLVYESGFESGHVSTTATVNCGWCRDDDADGWCEFYESPEVPYDCNDANPNIHPYAPEVCDGLDNNCDFVVDNAPSPVALASLRVTETDGTAYLTWDADSVATHYDVVNGDLEALRGSSGDYAVATEACLASNVIEPVVEDPAPLVVGAGRWYLLRGENCAGPGSFADPGGTLPSNRDSGIQASGNACP